MLAELASCQPWTKSIRHFNEHVLTTLYFIYLQKDPPSSATRKKKTTCPCFCYLFKLNLINSKLKLLCVKIIGPFCIFRLCYHGPLVLQGKRIWDV